VNRIIEVGAFDVTAIKVGDVEVDVGKKLVGAAGILVELSLTVANGGLQAN
jgi:hypothetical protein